MVEKEPEKIVSPSEFMRQLRPEYYSDTTDRTMYQLDAPTLEYHLETITSRNQTHDFEIFCRKLCERTICPNLKPATGPEGGGDSKADTETISVAEEITTLGYVGNANAGQERWAFAFSAKKKWAEKVRNDVAGIIATQRGYQRIYCITAQFARAKTRADVEDTLSRQYGVTVTILDRTWIIEQIINNDRKDLAFNYLNIGQEVVDTRRLGPSDYSRSQQLEDIEKTLSDPEAFAGMETQCVKEALVAAKLSRNLERPRIETDGRFARAIRLAEQDGTYYQKIEAHYEQIWTAYWWFDDITGLNDYYSTFESLVINTEHAKILEFLCNLAQLLFNSVLHQHLTIEETRLPERMARLTDKLKSMLIDSERPNNALQAKTFLLFIQVNQAMIDRNFQTLNSLWPQFSEVLKQAKGLGEFSAEYLPKVIEVFGGIAGDDPSYAQLVEDVAEFVTERTGEAQGALILLKRAEQLNFKNNFEMIRLLGKATRQLTKKEYAESLIEAHCLLSIAYRNVGLLWAARASCIFAITSIFIEAEENNDLPTSVVPTIMILLWIALELRHLPDTLEAVELIQRFRTTLPLTDSSKALIDERLQHSDLVFASQILNYTLVELQQVVRLPDVLNWLGLVQSRDSLAYVLGHETLLREKGVISEEETPESVTEFFTLLASQPASDNTYGPIIFNNFSPQYFASRVQGIQVTVHHDGSDTSILIAEIVIGSIEALFATMLDFSVHAHTERFTITVQENVDITKPDFKVDEETMTATVFWPTGLNPATYGKQGDICRMLIGLTVTIFAATCVAKNLQQLIEHLAKNEAAIDRITMLIGTGNSYRRIFGKSVLRLSDWTQKEEATTYSLEPSRPIINRHKLENTKNDDNGRPVGDKPNIPDKPRDHRNFNVSSVIDMHLWDRAVWKGVAFADWGAPYPPAMALVFTNEDAARKIFTRWQERFGKTDKQDEIYVAIIRDLFPEHPAYYRTLITSRIPDEYVQKQLVTVLGRIQTMKPQSDINLRQFLGAYQRSGSYLLAPAILRRQCSSPEILTDIAILKRALSVKTAAEVGEHDLEMMGLRVKQAHEN